MKKRPRQQLYNSRGITLIALVITIIVMLILVAITLLTLTGDNGILTKGYRAEEETNKVQAKELLQLAVTGLRLEAVQKGETFDIEYIRTNLNNYLGRDDSIALSDLTIDVVSQDYQNITGTVKYEKKEYEYTIYWDNLQVAMEKVLGGKDNIPGGEQQTTFAVTVTIDGGDTTKGTTCQGGRVASGSGYPLYVIMNPSYRFTGWEIVSGNATIVDANKPKTALQNVTSDVTVVAKYETSNLLVATSDKIQQGYVAWDQEGREIVGTCEDSSKKLVKKSGKLDFSNAYRSTPSIDTTYDVVAGKTYTFSSKSKEYGAELGFDSFDVGLSEVVSVSVDWEGEFWIVYNGDKSGYVSPGYSYRDPWAPSIYRLIIPIVTRNYDGKWSWWTRVEFERGKLSISAVCGYSPMEIISGTLTYAMQYKCELYEEPKWVVYGYE